MITLDINTKVMATTQYLNWEYNSAVKFGRTYLGASAAGLFKIGGDTDNGQPITAFLETGATDLGLEHNKRLRFVYIGMKCSGNLLLEIMVDGGAWRSYTIAGGPTRQNVSVPIGRDGAGRYWTFRLSNVDGVPFSVWTLQTLPVVLPLGFGRRR